MGRPLTGSIIKERKPNGKPTGRVIARVRYTDHEGRQREKKKICPTDAAARAQRDEWIDEITAGTIDNPPQQITYRQLDAFYKLHYVHEAKFVGGKKRSGFRQSVDTIERYMDRALAHFADRPLPAITYADLLNYKRLIESTPVIRERNVRSKIVDHATGKEKTVVSKIEQRTERSVSDVHHHLKRVRRMLNVAVQQGWITVSPFKLGEQLIIETFEAERTRVLTQDEERRLLDACLLPFVYEYERQRHGRTEKITATIDPNPRAHLARIIIFAVETACRLGEIQRLRWNDVNMQGRFVTIAGRNTKTLKTRLVPITARLLKVLTDMRQIGNLPVFGQYDFKHAWHGACREADLEDVDFHDLRHTAITRMLERSIPPTLVKKISGHTQDRTFMRYVNQTEQSIYEIAMLLDRAAA